MAYFSTSLSSTLSYTFQNVLPGDVVDIIVSYAPVNQQNGHVDYINSLVYTASILIEKKDERMHSLYNAIIKEGLLGKLLCNDLITRMDENICNAVMKCLKTGYSSLPTNQRKVLGNLPPECTGEITEQEYLEIYKRIRLIQMMYFVGSTMNLSQVYVCTRAAFVKRCHLRDSPIDLAGRFITIENMAVIKEDNEENRFIFYVPLSRGLRDGLCNSFRFLGVQYSRGDEISDNQSS